MDEGEEGNRFVAVMQCRYGLPLNNKEEEDNRSRSIISSVLKPCVDLLLGTALPIFILGLRPGTLRDHSYSLLTTSSSYLSSVENIFKPEYLPPTAYD